MATPDDIAEAKRIANARKMAQTAVATTPVVAPVVTTPTVDPYYVRDPKTGLSPAQVEANAAKADALKNLEATAKAAEASGQEVKIIRPYDGPAQIIPKPTPPPADANYRYDYEWVGASVSTERNPGLGKWKLVQYPNAGPADWMFDSNGMLFHKGKAFTGTYQGVNYVDGKGPGYKESGSGSKPTTDQATLDLIKSLQDQLAALGAGNQQAAINKAAEEAAAKKEKAENAIAVLTDRFSRYGLTSLVPKIRELAIAGASESTITLQLQETEEYKTRFKANEDRIKKGLRVLEPSDYLNIEDDYRQILRAYGLRQFDTDAYVQQFISNDISTTELSNRVVTAVQRVQNADPAILATLRGYYGISDNDLVAYVLDPNQQFQKIERQVAAAEIGAAAGLQGLTAGVTVAEQLAAQGVTKAQAQKGYATIADILPTAEKLSDIYKGTLDEYRQSEAEQEIFNTLASAQRKRRALAEREIATFAGGSGLSKTALDQTARGSF
jgi:hypothetical protein